jgi:hypothetical protein
VGALLADWDADSPGPDIRCSGTLIGERVFLTAAHCTAFLESEGIAQVWVTFAPAYDEDSTSLSGLFAGTSVTHPEFGAGGASDPHDIAVVLLERSPGIAPAVLPAAGLLDQLKANHSVPTGPSPRWATAPSVRPRPAGRTRCSSTASGALPSERAQPGEELAAAVHESLHRGRRRLLR